MNFSELASDERINNAKNALENNGIDVLVAENGEDAKKKVFELLPQGAEVMNMTSVTLDAIGVAKELLESGKYNAVRNMFAKMDKQKDASQMQKLGAAPDWVVGSQKIVRNMDEATKRVHEYVLPLEDQRAMKAYGQHSFVSKALVINREVKKGRITMIIVKEKLGF